MSAVKSITKGFQQDVARELGKLGIDLDKNSFTTAGALYLQESEGKLSAAECAKIIAQNKDKYLRQMMSIKGWTQVSEKRWVKGEQQKGKFKVGDRIRLKPNIPASRNYGVGIITEVNEDMHGAYKVDIPPNEDFPEGRNLTGRYTGDQLVSA